MDSTILAAVIGALSGLAGAFLGAHMTTRSTKAKSERDELKSTQYLATMVAPELDRFAAQCLLITYDDGYEEGQPAGRGGECGITVYPIEFKPGDFTVDWQALTGDLMKAALTFPETWRALAADLNDEDRYYDPPDHTGFFADRQYIFCKVGLEALKLAKRLYAEAKFQPTDAGPGSIAGRLQARLLDLNIERAKEKLRLENWKRFAKERNLKTESGIIP